VNELQSVVDAYVEARARGERAALATVVGVVGSAYRRPGARMLITGGGRAAGSISGGCLERDVAERAARVMETGAARVVEYDTRGDEDVVWGLGLGCNGVVRVLIESLHEGGSAARALRFIGGRLRERRPGVLATVIRAPEATRESGARYEGAAYRFDRLGERLPLDESESDRRDDQGAGGGLVARIREDARAALAAGRAAARVYGSGADRIEVFFDLIRCPRPLVIFGAEHDADHVARLARGVGWHVTVVDTRAREASRRRFAAADEVVLCRAGEVASRVALSRETAAVVMTHNYLDDAELLRALLPSPARYVGVLGPKRRTEKLLEELRAGGEPPARAQLARLHAPVGIDIGAETPEEIALSIVAEIKAACDARPAGFLRDGLGPIHGGRGEDAGPTELSSGPCLATGGAAREIYCGTS
jgi:xanthine/CO dehydrogenase XdhC/CoxF family maturation factor